MKRPPYKLAAAAPTSPRQDFVTMLVYGPSDTGRSSLAFTAPGPMCYTHCAEKIEGLLQLRNEAHIAQHGYPMGEFDFSFPYQPTPELIEKSATTQWKKLRNVLGESLTYARSTINDTVWDSYQLPRYAYFGDLAPGKGRVEREWGPPNQDWFKTIKLQFRNQLEKKPPRTNLILIAPSTDEYGPSRRGMLSEKTGKVIPDIQKSIYRWCDVVVCTSRKLEGGSMKFYATIEKPWMNEQARGVEIDVTNNPTSFEDIMFEITDEIERWQ